MDLTVVIRLGSHPLNSFLDFQQGFNMAIDIVLLEALM